MIELTDLPGVNAALNTVSAVLLAVGWDRVRHRRVRAHRVCMLAACAASALFLVSYLVYHYQVGSVRFQGSGWVRTVYLSILLTHTVLATAIVPLVIVTLVRAFRERFEKHRRIARWTLPLWLYVNVTGVVIYWMLYRCDFGGGAAA